MANKTKQQLHPRNRHQERYDLAQLTKVHPALESFIQSNPKGEATIDFFDANAVLHLNTALLKQHYGIEYWSFPEGYLCPPIPGRADYLHYVADLLAEDQEGKIPKGPKVKCLDIGTGASCIYPIIGTREYGWTFVGVDIDPSSVASAQRIVERNPLLSEKISIRLQKNPEKLFRGIIRKGEYYAVTICNPPFYTSVAEAQQANLRKLRNLKGKKAKQPISSFGGQHNEIWCNGGEQKFIQDMIWESKFFARSVGWFTTLVAQEKHLKGIYAALNKAEANQVKTIEMGQGQKRSRMVAWHF